MSTNIYKEEEYTKRFDFKLWKQIFQYALNYKKYLILIISVMILTAAVEGAFPYMTKYAIDHFIAEKTTENIGAFIAVFVGLLLVQTANIFLFIDLAGKVETLLVYDIRKDTFNRLQHLSFSYYDKTPVGWIMARMTSDCQKLGSVIAWGMVDISWGFTMMIIICGIMLFMNWKLALTVLSVIPILIWISMYFQKKILSSYRKSRKENSKLTGSYNEGIHGAKTTKTLVRENENLKEFQETSSGLYSASVKASILSSMYFPIILLIGAAGSALAIWFGGNGVISGIMTYGTLVAFVSYMIHFFEPVNEVSRMFAELQNAQASAERVISLLNSEIEIKDSFINNHNGGLQTKIDGNVKFNNVSFYYKKGEYVLKDFNLDIRKGEKIALVGETGSGKTTLVNLACRFYEPVAGRILIDNKDYKSIPLEVLQSNIGIVLQTPHLFSGTVMDNIRYGKLDTSDAEVVQAAKTVHAHQFITGLEKGYNTEVGESGNLLSTGQKQLISFARAILADPAILVLDEATSSVDTETEFLIQDAIDKVMENRTSIIIAHRLSTIRSADKIIVLKKGEIIEIGNHSSLINEKGYYYKLYTNQFMEEKEMELLS